MIDTNAGGAYPEVLLRAWKQLQEAQIRKERDGLPTNIGWVDRFLIQNSFLFEKDATIYFGKCSVLQGGSFGKTAICDWIVANLGGSLQSRWHVISSQILSSVICYTPEVKAIEATFQDGAKKLVVNGVAVVEMPRLVSVVYLREGVRRLLSDSNGEDDERIAAALETDRTVIKDLMPDIQRYGTEWGRNLAFYDEPKYLGEDAQGVERYSDDETEVVLSWRRAKGNRGIVFGALSGSETVRVLIEFACALARERARHYPTILLLDGSDWPFDQRNMDSCGSYLSDQPYQVVLTARDGWEPDDRSAWLGWNRNKVIKLANSTRIEIHDW